MADQSDDLIPTRATLLGRLKNTKDQSSWREFFDTYSRLIYGIAHQAGLTDEEAQQVLQATMDSVADQMPSFRYDRRLGSFKEWLLKLTRMQIVSRSLKRRPSPGRKYRKPPVENDPSGQTVERMWETAWQKNLTEAAIANVKRRLDPKKYQIYDLQVNKQLPAEKIAALMTLSVEEISETRRTVAELIQAELKRLEQQMI